MKKALRWAGRGFLALVLLLILAGAGGYLFLRSGLPQSDGRIALAGLERPVEVLRDSTALVTIRAESQLDSYVALGFVHAQDRFGQMELTRRIGQGRLSEVAGEATLGFDQLMRLLRIYTLAEDSLAQLSAESRQSLEAYTRGVNAYLERHGGAWPPEFYLLGITEPEPWRPADSLVWGKLMALQLSGDWRDELRRARLLEQLGAERFHDLFPAVSAQGPTTLSGLPLGETLLSALPPEMGNLGASNAWSLTANRSASGAPLLANDPHLRLQAPPQWYLVRIETPDGVRAGATAPGVPVIVIGHNGTAAWGFTTTHSDTQDLIIEKIDPADPERYLTPEGARPFESWDETIALRGGETVSARFRATRHGPVISDYQAAARGEDGSEQVMALAWPGLAPGDTTAQAFFELNNARSWPAFRAAVSGFVAPQQNIFYADVDGAIGFIAPGKVPLRDGYDGSLPTSGWDKKAIWSGFIPFAELPQGLNPPNGQFVNANNKITPPGYPYILTTEYELPYRAERIESLLAGRNNLTVEDMQAIQTDIRSPLAAELLPLLLATAPRNADGEAALALLRAWDGTMAPEDTAPLIFSAWLHALDAALFQDELGPAFGELNGYDPRRIATALRARPAWCDDIASPATESCREILAESLDAALGILATRGDPLGQTWGQWHRAKLGHPIFSRIPVLGGLFTLEPATGGGNFTVNRGTPALSEGDDLFRHIHGPGLRAVFDLADLDNSRFMISSGQSGNVLSPHFGDLAPLWRDGGYLKLVAPAQDEAERLVLTPRE